ncbi:DUF4271 domain-containing protein [Sphingobacterium sp. MYb382]|uniref:DUF4271 domain-containing protein n=1 Tax=Sphingobacterium sp. MYb382 TaxID=2745278 RepID=UPI00309CBFA0
MHLLRYFFQSLLVFVAMSQLAVAQRDTLTQPGVVAEMSADSTAHIVVDSFNYVFPPANRPNQLFVRFMAEIQANSVSLEKAMDAIGTQPRLVESAEGGKKEMRPTWVLAVVFILFFAVGLVRLIFPTDFMLIVDAYYNERTLQQVSKEDNMLTSWPYVFLYLIFSLALGLFMLLIESSFTHYYLLRFDNYLRVSLVVSLLFIVKILLIRFVSFIFELDRLVREYVTVLYLVYFNSMLFLMPFLLALLFVPSTYFKILLILFSVIVASLFVYRFLRTFFRLFGNLRFSVFYLILYLCTLEVAPILILVKLLSS